jgi:hypothetical protein
MMNEQTLEDTIIEVKEDFMLSPNGDSEPTLRTAHLLKPIANSIDEPTLKFNQFSSFDFEPKEWPLKINFTGWRHPQQKWVCWLDKLKPKFESVWKEVGIFEAIMSSKCCILKNQNLLQGVVEKWCCDTNTFIFPFGEATITLEDIIVLGGYPIIGDHVFTKVKDQEMREVENKLIRERKQLTTKNDGHAYTSLWMDMFIDKGNEIEHEAFLATWLSIFVFPHKNMVKSSLFPIAIHLARGIPIALAPAVLASIYKDLSLFKKTIIDMFKYPVSGDRFPVELTLLSPFYLVQVWVWERFTKLQPQPMSINPNDPLLFRWHKVQALKIENVKLALDLTVDDFLWRPYVRYPEKCGIFYPNNEIWVPFKKDLDKNILSFFVCLRVSELVGFESIEQYLPHRVSMQFGIDQDVPSNVPRCNGTKPTAWNNYCRPMSDKNLYFPPRLFEADVTMRYVKWWKKSVLGRGDFVKKIVKRKSSVSSRKHVPTENSALDCVKADENIVASSISIEDCNPAKESNNVIVEHPDLSFHSDMAVQEAAKETVREKGRNESDHEEILLEEEYLKNQEELPCLERQKEELSQLIDLKKKRGEELRKRLSVLRNQQPPSSSS